MSLNLFGEKVKINFIDDGDVTGVISVVDTNSPIDIYLGTGGGPEGVLAAAALHCLGGQMQTRLVLNNNDEIKRAKILGITDLNKKYLDDKLLNIKIMGRGMAWLDMGTIDSLQEASFYIRTLEQRQGLKVGCPEEVAWRQGWINDLQLEKLAHRLSSSGYGQYLTKLLKTKYTR